MIGPDGQWGQNTALVRRAIGDLAVAFSTRLCFGRWSGGIASVRLAGGAASNGRVRCPPSVHGRCVRLALLASIASPPPSPPPGRAGAQLDRRAAMDGGLGCRVGRGFELFCSWSRRHGRRRKQKEKQEARSACGVGAFVVGRVSGLVDSSWPFQNQSSGVQPSSFPDPGSSRQSWPARDGGRWTAAWDSVGSVWLTDAVCRPLTGHSGHSLRGHWTLTGRPASRPRARVPPLSQAPGKAPWRAWAALADPSSSPQSHCWSKRA